MTTVTTAVAQITSVAPTVVKPDHITISWARRSTEKNPVKESERYRGIEVAASLLAIEPQDCRSKFTQLLQSTIHSLADAKFTAWVKDNMAATEVAIEQFNLDNVLLFWAEEKQRAAIDADKVTAWLKDSATLKALPEAKRDSWLKLLPKIAAPNYRVSGNFTPASAATIVAKIAEEDTDHPVCIFVMTRCNSVMNAPVTQADAF